MFLIIGYGSLLRSDDGLGQYLAQLLADRRGLTTPTPDESGWNFMTSTQLTPELAEPLSRAERAVFLDALMGGTPGAIRHYPLEPLAMRAAFVHHVTPASLLAMAHELYGAAPDAMQIAVAGASFAFGTDFSPQIRALLPRITAQVDELIVKFFTPDVK